MYGQSVNLRETGPGKILAREGVHLRKRTPGYGSTRAYQHALVATVAPCIPLFALRIGR